MSYNIRILLIFVRSEKLELSLILVAYFSPFLLLPHTKPLNFHRCAHYSEPLIFSRCARSFKTTNVSSLCTSMLQTITIKLLPPSSNTLFSNIVHNSQVPTHSIFQHRLQSSTTNISNYTQQPLLDHQHNTSMKLSTPAMLTLLFNIISSRIYSVCFNSIQDDCTMPTM